MTVTASASNSGPLERDAQLISADHETIKPGDIAIGVIIGRTSEFFDFFVYAIASFWCSVAGVPFVTADRTLYSFALFSLAFIGRRWDLDLHLPRQSCRGVK